MDTKRIIEKIKKCMALGKSSNVHEAAAAMRQAQKMMEQYGLTEDDIEGSNYGNEAVECPIQAGKKVPVHLNAFVNLIIKAFQVKAVIERNLRVSDYSFRIRYFGPTHRVATAAYAHAVIFRAMESAWREHLKNNPSWKGVRGARLSFMLGWLDEISSKVEAIGWPAEEEARTELMVDRYYGKSLVKASGKSRQVSMFGCVADEGRAAASGFEINRPMSVNRARLGKF